MHYLNRTIQPLCFLSILILASIKGHTAPFVELPPSKETVTITGWLHVEGHTMQDVVLEVTVNGTSELVRVSETGRFDVELPSNAEALMRFEKPGHLPKELIVNTHHAGEGEFAEHKRKVKFAVIMELARHKGRMTYAGPVGSIGFDPDGGCLSVSHDKRMVPERLHQTVEF